MPAVLIISLPLICLLQELREEIGYKDAELAKRAAYIQQLEGLVHSGSPGNQSRQLEEALLTELNQPLSHLKTPLTLKWRQGKDMPNKMGSTVQSVVIEGKVYIGGGRSSGDRGNADSDRYSCTVMVYDLQKKQWNTLPPYNAYGFAMTELNNQLVLAGGQAPATGIRTNEVAVLELEKWAHPYPPMNNVRSHSIAVSFNNHILVAGGYDDQDWPISSVEVLDIPSNRWCTSTDPLPIGRVMMKAVVVGDMCYIIGGYDHTDNRTKMVHRVNLRELTKNAPSTPDKISLWQTVEDTPFFYSAPLPVKGSLWAVGGIDDMNKTSTSIHLYQPGTRRWMKVGDLPTARYCCTCSVLHNGEILVAGGMNSLKSYLGCVDFLNITESS